MLSACFLPGRLQAATHVASSCSSPLLAPAQNRRHWPNRSWTAQTIVLALIVALSASCAQAQPSLGRRTSQFKSVQEGQRDSERHATTSHTSDSTDRVAIRHSRYPVRTRSQDYDAAPAPPGS